MRHRAPVDKLFLGIVVALATMGFLIFLSAAMGLIARESARFSAVVFNQLFFGLFLGSIACFAASRIPYRVWGNYAPHFFISALALTALVFVPSLGIEHGGARRWIDIGPVSFQPVEILKITFVMLLAAWLTLIRKKVSEFPGGLVPLSVLLGAAGVLLLLQPNTSSLIIMAITGGTMFFVSGARIRHLALIGLVLLAILGGLVAAKPYLRERLITFVNPAIDPLGSGYQIQQSLIAIGSGGMIGRGFGQSVQKFDFLPEPIGDSIFAVAAEEFGFAGMLILLALFLAFCLRGFRIAARARHPFGRLLVVGLVILITIQSLMNIAAMLGVFPLTGTPLLFVSHGGTALLVTLFASGIILNVSRSQGAT